ncbi:carbohydrate ABC transporter permease [Frondihabitans australicus]|uniref:Carbohydrate ABC transporter membrane protein 1 (CUT1 family) n=1 Tax=Frondihabitans australicus TaxID=386892 RepID=A0A495IIR9_9MICO|nr:sugar ABC transporter permease [Frondihabitans australicus]RKR75298.1 carbohydrate ABC transporter membrane protein 1 (CUT1 family) [Frondihabitans australicus]
MTTRKSRSTSANLLYVLPFFVLFAVFFAWPTVYGLYLSFTDRNLAAAKGPSLVGFANYLEAFSDPSMWSSLANTLWFTVITTIPLVILALVVALLINMNLRGTWFWRLSVFMPYLFASTVVSLIWVWLFDPNLGLVNTLLSHLGITGPAWLQDPGTAMSGVAVATVWWTIGFNFLLYLSALQNIPQQLYEAAAVDGATKWRQVRSITLPLLGRTTGLVVALQILASLKVFDQIYQMTGGGPNGATRSILEYVYDTGFSNYRLGYASAISYVFFAIILILSIAQFSIFNRRGSAGADASRVAVPEPAEAPTPALRPLTPEAAR